MPLWTAVYKYLVESLLSVLWNIHTRSDLLGHMVLRLHFSVPIKLFCTVAAPFMFACFFVFYLFTFQIVKRIHVCYGKSRKYKKTLRKITKSSSCLCILPAASSPLPWFGSPETGLLFWSRTPSMATVPLAPRLHPPGVSVGSLHTLPHKWWLF